MSMGMKGILAVVLALVLVTFVFAYSTPPTSAHSGDVLSAFATVIPTIDGTISAGEWDDAATVSFIIGVPSGTPTQFLDSTLFVKNDDTNLYLAWVIKNEDFDPVSVVGFDLARFHFDNDHDGLREIGDDAINCAGITVCQDEFRQNALNQEAGDACCGGTNDISFAASHTNPITDAIGDYVFEVSHPLNTNDDSHDFSLLAGDTVGLGLEFFDAGIGSGWFPSPSASNWADIVIASLLQPLALFSPEVEFELGPNPNDDSLEVEVDFTLGIDSNGLNIPIEIVSLELTGVSPITIPAGSFEMRDDGSFHFEGTVNGVPVKAEIEPNPKLGANAFTFELEADNQNLPGTPGIDFPVTMTLTIGDDQGTADVDAEVED